VAVPVFFLLCGMLASEFALFGFAAAGIVGGAFFALSALVLSRAWFAARSANVPADGAREPAPAAARRSTVGAGAWQPSHR
jgi:hypothetical protein